VSGALATVLGITMFVGVGQPAGGVTQPAAAAWWTAALLALGAIAILGSLAARVRGSVGAALFAAAAGLSFAFQAAVTKEFVGVVGGGLDAILSSWTTWALVGSALVGFALQQSALKTGFLAPAIAASNAATLLGSVLLGALVFEEHLVAPGQPVLPACLGLALAVGGVVLLAVPGGDDAGRDDQRSPRATSHFVA
jgi:hypothetical protein